MPVADQHQRGQAHGIALDCARAVAGLELEPELADLVVVHLELGRHVGLTRVSGGRRRSWAQWDALSVAAASLLAQLATIQKARC